MGAVIGTWIRSDSTVETDHRAEVEGGEDRRLARRKAASTAAGDSITRCRCDSRAVGLCS